ncbi:MAG: hypothetical protein IKZ05_01755, partial [Clostridia bacterium]|nr:hypothetical protein [Clostridia bacterium]
MKTNRLVRITAGEMLCTLSLGNEGITLFSIRDRKTKKNFLTNERPIFTLTARALANDDTVTVASNEGWASVGFERAENDYVFILSGNKTLGGVTVILCAHTVGNRIEWSVSLVSGNNEYSLYSCDYPTLSFDS